MKLVDDRGLENITKLYRVKYNVLTSWRSGFSFMI